MKKKADNTTGKDAATETSKAMVAEKPAKSSNGEEAKSVATDKKSTEKPGNGAAEKGKKAGLKRPTSRAPTQQKPPKSSHLFLLIFALIIAGAGVALAGYDFWLLRLQAPINEQFVESQRAFDDRIDQLQQQLQLTRNQLSDERQARKASEAEQEALKAAMQSINEKLGRSTLAWRMAEIEYLLTVANDRLLLAGDRQTAMAIFKTADERLKALGDPSLLTVRKKIAEELTALRAMAEVDVSGLVLTLASLAESVPKLPLRDQKRLAVVTEKQQRPERSSWKELPSVVWADIKSLVQVRRHQQPTEPLLPPQQAVFLYQNLQLKLEQAKLAALQRDSAVFAQSLRQASQWLASYFEVEAPAVVAMQASLNRLQTVELQPPMPEVGGSLRELRAIMNARASSGVKEAGSP